MAVLPGASELPDDERNMFKRNKEPRFYENDVPEVNSLVMVKVLRVAETSAYVMCLEYSGLEGMILFSEVSTRRIRSMLKEIRAGQFCVCMVLRVDKEKGHLDLSRRRVNADDRAGFLQKYAKSKLVHSTMRQLSAVHSLNCEELCSKIAWPLYKRFPHAIDAFKQYINTRDDSIFKEMDVPEKVKTDMLAIIEKKLTPQAIKLKAKIEVSCYEIEGIDAVKAALMAGLDDKEHREDDGPMGKIVIKVVAPPHYDVTTQSVGKEAGMQAIEAALGRIEAKIKEKEGNFTVRSKPEVQEGGDDEILERDVASDAERDDDDDDDDDDQDETMGNVDLGDFEKK